MICHALHYTALSAVFGSRYCHCPWILSDLWCLWIDRPSISLLLSYLNKRRNQATVKSILEVFVSVDPRDAHLFSWCLAVGPYTFQRLCHLIHPQLWSNVITPLFARSKLYRARRQLLPRWSLSKKWLLPRLNTHNCHRTSSQHVPTHWKAVWTLATLSWKGKTCGTLFLSSAMGLEFQLCPRLPSKLSWNLNFLHHLLSDSCLEGHSTIEGIIFLRILFVICFQMIL